MHVIQQLFRMKQSADDGVYDPGLITLLESLPKDDEAAQTTPLKTAKKGGSEKTTPPQTAKGDGSTPTPAKTTGKKRQGASKKKEKKGASKKRKGADDGSDDGTGSKSWPSSSEVEDAD